MSGGYEYTNDDESDYEEDGVGNSMLYLCITLCVVSLVVSSLLSSCGGMSGPLFSIWMLSFL